MKPKTKNIIVWILAGLLAFALISAGITKLLGTEMQIKNLESWHYPLWFRYPIGLAEIVLAVALLIPKYRKAAVYGTFIWTLVAVITLMQAGQYSTIPAPIVFSVLGGLILFLSNQPKRNLQFTMK